jgi:beta-N-acetylhexosaminidase
MRLALLAQLACLATAALAACGASHNAPAHSIPAITTASTSAPTPNTTAQSQDPVAARTANLAPLQRLSLSQLAGQRIVYAYRGLTPPASLLSRIRRGEAAGVIFFEPNIASRSQLRATVQELQAANASSPVHAPLLMMVDQEGGLVRRLPGAPEQSEKQIGGSEGAEARARQAGYGAGMTLARAGLNVNLAPVVDVFRHPGNFIDQYERSYGSSPRLVSQLSRAFIQAQQHVGIAATAKHFPGLGAAGRHENTDEGPVVLSLPLAQLRAIDEAPYRAAISAGVRLVMLSWATYPALDPTLPAGLSPTVISGELRRRLGYRGVTVTDSLEAGALNAFGGPAERAALAAAAGDDLLLCSARTVTSNSPAIGVAALHGVVSAIASREVSRASAEEAAARVTSLRLGL